MIQSAIAKTLYQKLYEGMIQQRLAALDTILADSFILVHMTGLKQTKKEWLQAIEVGEMRYFSVEDEKIEVVEEADSAMLQGQSLVDAEIYGTRHKWRLQLQLSFVFSGDEWLIEKAVAHSY